jgi:hypothetical protein
MCPLRGPAREQLVVFDDYGKVAGETRAVDELLRRRPLRLEKLPICHIPPSRCVEVEKNGAGSSSADVM